MNIHAVFFNCKRFEYALIFFVCGVLLALLQLHPSFPDPDSFYHARIATDMLRGPVVAFSALPFTTLSDIFIDHHFLYHILLFPFIAFLNPLVGLKIATVLFAAGFLTFFYWLVRTFTHARPLIALGFLIFLILNTVFLFRLNLAKIPAVSLMVFFAGLYAIIKEKYAPLFGLSFLYVWLYGGWPLLPASAALAWFIRGIVCHRASDKQGELRITNYELRKFPSYELRVTSYKILQRLFSWSNLKLPAASLSGALAGLVINPYFPTNLFFYWVQTFKIAMLNILTAVPVGGEWYPPGIAFIPVHGPTLMLLVFSLSAFFLPGLFSSVFRTTKPSRSWEAWFLFVLALAFFILTVRSRRYGEYFAPVATLFSALVLTPLLSADTFGRSLTFVRNALAHPRTLRGAVIIYFLIAGPLIVGTNLWLVVESFRTGISFTRYENGVAWITEHIPKGSTIFHHRWDDFPLLYYRAPGYRYISGLDARFFYEKDSVRTERYTAFSAGADLGDTFGYRALCSSALFSLRPETDAKLENLATTPLECTPREEVARALALIASFNPAAIVMTAHDFLLEKKIRKSPGLSEVYRDDEMVVFMTAPP